MKRIAIALSTLVTVVACSTQPRLRPDKLPARGLDCPDRPPAQGDACPARAVGQACWYGDLPRCPAAACTSVNGAYAWYVSAEGCPMDCPANAPSDGDACPSDAFQTCAYDAHGVYVEHGAPCDRTTATCRAGKWIAHEVKCEGGV